MEGAISSRIVYTEEARALQELWSGLTEASSGTILAVKEIRLGGYFRSAYAWAVGEPKAVRPPEFVNLRLQEWGPLHLERNLSLEQPRPIIVVDLFPEILSELLDLLVGLSAEDWQTPTVCRGWSVKDVALHLLGVKAGDLSRRRDGHRMENTVGSWKELVTAINDWNQAWVRAARRISPRLLVDLLQLTGVQTCDYYRSLDPYAIGGPVAWVGPEPVPVWLDLAREYTERWHHQQHIRDAVGKPGLKQPRYFAPVLATFVWAMPNAFRSTVAAENTSVTLRITGESGGRWSLLSQGSEWRLYMGAPEQPNAEVIIDEDIAWRLFTRGLTSSQAREHVAVHGDEELGLKVLEMISIIA